MSRVKGTLPVPGGRETFINGDGEFRAKKTIQTTLFILCHLLPTDSSNSTASSMFHKVVVSLSERHKSFPLCLLF